MKLTNPEIRIETTNVCNAHCTMCAHDQMTRAFSTMNDELFESIISQASDLGVKLISLFGFGEPLIDPKIAERIKLCSDRGFETFITTNASLLGVDIADSILSAGLSHIRFSFHALHPNDYEEVHKGLNYNTVLRNIGNFISRNNLRYHHQCKVSVSVIPMHNEGIQDIRDKWEKHVDYLEVWRPHNWGSAKHYRLNTIKRKKSCGRPQRGPIQIQADGTIIPCCFLTNNELVLGDVHEKTIEGIIKDKPYKALRLAHKIRNLTGYPCATCDQLNIEEESPLLYSNREDGIGKTSSIKFKLLEA